MTTLVLGTVGSLIGGPIGGALGAAIGSRIDNELFGPGPRQGPRMQELAVTTSSYGAAIPAHIGSVRTSGTIIWATDLQEDSETSGGKGKPKTTTYSYSMSFAVLLASAPIDGIGRIWADGNLLRGAAGDLKTGGTLRVHEGRGNQPVDPLLGATLGTRCPAYRGCAYAVFEDLQLAEFGNRLPALTFEVFNGSGADVVPMLASQAGVAAGVDTLLTDITGYSNSGHTVRDNLQLLQAVEPLSVDMRSAEPVIVPILDVGRTLSSDPAVWDEGEYGTRDGTRSDRSTAGNGSIDGLRYYDMERDYLPGLQRRVARSPRDGNALLELPATLSPASARRLVERISERSETERGRVHYRAPELDPDIGAGMVVRLADRPGLWRVEAWEWRERGVEYELTRYRTTMERALGDGATPGRPWLPSDRMPGASFLEAFELPADGRGGSTIGSTFVAVGGRTGRWAGASLFAERGDTLQPVAETPQRSAIVGTLDSVLDPSRSLLAAPKATFDVTLFDSQATLPSVGLPALAMGASRALVGEEILQFASARPLGSGRWRLEGLLRGRGGTEQEALNPHMEGERFVLLDDRIQDVGERLGQTDTRLAAIGTADEEPVRAQIALRGRSTQPLSPVHGSARMNETGGLSLTWVRRARGAWHWRDGIDVPLVEETERYEIGIGPIDAPLVSISTSEPEAQISSAALAVLPGEPLPVWVRQRGSFSSSPALLLTIWS